MPSVKAITCLNQNLRLFRSAPQRNLLPSVPKWSILLQLISSLNGFLQTPVWTSVISLLLWLSKIHRTMHLNFSTANHNWHNLDDHQIQLRSRLLG